MHRKRTRTTQSAVHPEATPTWMCDVHFALSKSTLLISYWRLSYQNLKDIVHRLRVQPDYVVRRFFSVRRVSLHGSMMDISILWHSAAHHVVVREAATTQEASGVWRIICLCCFNYHGSVAAFHVGTWTTLIKTSRWFVAESLESTKSNTVAYESSACSEVPVNLGQSLHAESKGQVDDGFQRLSSQQRLLTVDLSPRRTEDLIKKITAGFLRLL